MPTTTQSKEIISKILSAKSAVVTAHLNPDGDTLGSMLALAKVLEQAGVEIVHRVMHDEVPEIYKFFPDQEKVLCSMKEEDLAKTLPEYDLSFSCDCGSVARLGSSAKVWQRAKTTCNIDHHLSNPLYGDLNWVDAEATCTGQVVKYLAEELNSQGKQIDTKKDLASLYYITLLTDTGGFRHSNTNETVFKWASELVMQGADANKLYNQLFNQMPFRAIKTIGDALNKLELTELNTKYGKIKVAYTYTTRRTLDQFGAKDEDTDEIVDHIMRVKNLDLCLYLREGNNPNSYKGSLRSSTSLIDCSLIASKLNGGGHARAAGFNPTADSFEELKTQVYHLITNY
jgi:bifunctional oligoribonuclease and PAP phosphatase NrnA